VSTVTHWPALTRHQPCVFVSPLSTQPIATNTGSANSLHTLISANTPVEATSATDAASPAMAFMMFERISF
jgi:hypothetical protein